MHTFRRARRKQWIRIRQRIVHYSILERRMSILNIPPARGEMFESRERFPAPANRGRSCAEDTRPPSQTGFRGGRIGKAMVTSKWDSHGDSSDIPIPARGVYSSAGRFRNSDRRNPRSAGLPEPPSTWFWSQVVRSRVVRSRVPRSQVV